VTEDTHLVALAKGSERYVFHFALPQRPMLLRLLGRFASNPELSFTEYDAVVVSQKVRSISDEEGGEVPHGRW